MVVRTDLFEEAGIEVPSTESWTWDEFDEIIAELDERYRDQGINGFVLAAGALDQNGPFFWGRYDGYHFTKEGVQKHDPDRAIPALERLKRQLAYCPDNVLGLSIDEANSVFLNGRACILDCWPSFIRAALQDPDQSRVIDNWAFIPYPEPGFTYLSLWDILISQFSDNKDAAWEWIKFYVNPDNDKNLFFRKHGIGPTMSTTYDDPELVAELPHDFPATKTNLARAKRPVVTNEAEWRLGEVVNEALNEIIGVDEAVEKLNESWAGMQPTRPEFELAKVQDLVEE
jgi:ABC-type glycerol-3-phosphate transport system substrate-binding protein